MRGVAFLGLKHAGKAMTGNANGGKGGSIILISSQLGLDGTFRRHHRSIPFFAETLFSRLCLGVPNAGAYSASKVRLRCTLLRHLTSLTPRSSSPFAA